MDIIIPIYLAIFAIMFFLIALFEERDNNTDDEDEDDKSSNLIILLMGLAITLFIVAGVCMMDITQIYYSPETNTIEEISLTTYRPLSYIFIGMGILGLILIAQKIMDYLGSQWKEG
jgi:heme/copper-type cytochrome/quinol oxidase subunit 2